jgi:hypothetical protein
MVWKAWRLLPRPFRAQKPEASGRKCPPPPKNVLTGRVFLFGRTFCATSADGNAGFALLKDFLTAAKVDLAQRAMSDAQGGPTDRATPQTFAKILRYWTGEKDFDAFRACLPTT